MAKKLFSGRLDYDRRYDNWEIITNEGRYRINQGTRLSIGDVGGIPIYAVLVRDGIDWSWAVTPIPSAPLDGMHVAVWDEEETALAGGGWGP